MERGEVTEVLLFGVCGVHLRLSRVVDGPRCWTVHTSSASSLLPFLLFVSHTSAIMVSFKLPAFALLALNSLSVVAQKSVTVRYYNSSPHMANA